MFHDLAGAVGRTPGFQPTTVFPVTPVSNMTMYMCPVYVPVQLLVGGTQKHCGTQQQFLPFNLNSRWGQGGYIYVYIWLTNLKCFLALSSPPLHYCQYFSRLHSLDRDQQIFSVIVQIANILGFEGRQCPVLGSHRQQVNGYECPGVSVKLFTKLGPGIGLAGRPQFADFSLRSAYTPSYSHLCPPGQIPVKILSAGKMFRGTWRKSDNMIWEGLKMKSPKQIHSIKL